MKQLRNMLFCIVIIVIIMLISSISVSAATYLWPVPDVSYISCYYGNGHLGIDIAASGDHEIVAAREGTVIAASSTACTHINNYPNACCNWGMGNYVQIRHSDGSYATYMHMRYGTVTVSVGQNISRGAKIGMMGSSGNSTGQHLHFQVGYSSSDTINVNPEVIGYDYNYTETPVDLGTDFYGYIINTKMWKHLTYDPDGNVTIRTETGESNQIWYFQRLDDGSYKITSVKDGLCLDVDNLGTTSGTNVKVCVSNSSAAQRWFIYGTSGEYKLKAQCTNCVLDIDGNNSADGTNVQMWEWNGSDAQIFQIWKLALPIIPKPTINVTVNNSEENNVIFNWSNVENAHLYDIRIQQNGETINTIWSVQGNLCSINLPIGDYTVNIAAVNKNFMNYTFSDEVPFTIKWVTPQIANLNLDKYAFRINEKVKFNLAYDRSQSVSVVVLKNGEKVDSSGEIVGEDAYTYIPTETGIFEAYLSVWNPAGYKDSEKISFTVYTEEDYPYEYNLSFDANGGTVSTENKTIINNSSYGELPTPFRAGYTFNGWYTESIGGTQVTSDTIVAIRADHTLYAQWLKNEPYTNSTVKRYDYTSIANYEFPYKYIINTALYNVTSNCNVIATGYKNGKLVSIAIKQYSQGNESFEFTGDIDEIKIMLWDSLSLMKPLSYVENIMSDKWELWGVGTIFTFS